MKVGMVGSRELPDSFIKFCEVLGEEAARRGHIVVSGNAKGADQAYARGAYRIKKDSVVVKLPWEAFERQAIKDEFLLQYEYSEDTVILAAKHHKAWSALSNGVKKLMIRNAAIAQNSDIVIATREKNINYGGTAHTISVAKSLNIPVICISEENLPRANLPLAASQIFDDISALLSPTNS
jgi:hypothetical protein